MLPTQVFLDAGVYRSQAAQRGVGGDDAVLPLLMFWERHDVPPFVPTATDTTTVALAQVQQGSWIVVCPLCNLGAQYASRTDPRYLCLHCLNEAVGGAWLTVTWPDDTTTNTTPDTIEAALRPRPTPNANWLPGETVADLHAQNAAHGIGV